MLFPFLFSILYVNYISFVVMREKKLGDTWLLCSTLGDFVLVLMGRDG